MSSCARTAAARAAAAARRRTFCRPSPPAPAPARSNRIGTTVCAGGRAAVWRCGERDLVLLLLALGVRPHGLWYVASAAEWRRGVGRLAAVGAKRSKPARSGRGHATRWACSGVAVHTGASIASCAGVGRHELLQDAGYGMRGGAVVAVKAYSKYVPSNARLPGVHTAQQGKALATAAGV